MWWTHFHVGLVGPVDDHVGWLAGWLAGWRCGGFIGVVLEEGGMVRLRLVSRRLSVLGRMKVVRWCCEEELLVELVTGKCWKKRSK